MKSKSKKRKMHEFIRVLGMMLFDVFASVLAYYLAFAIRFLVKYEFEAGVDAYLYNFWSSAPFYGVCIVAIFWLFHLYNAIWEYAGIRDFNRIFFASVSASILYVVGTMLFAIRLPLTVYGLGAAIQLVFIMVSRFAYKMYLMERNQKVFKKKNAKNVIIIGSEENAQLAYHKYEMTDNVVAFFDEVHSKRKRYINGVHIVTNLSAMKNFITDQKVRKVVLTDSHSLSEEQIKEVVAICEELEVAVKVFEGNNKKDQVYLASPTMHGEEFEYMKLAYDTNWMSTIGENIDAVEKSLAKFIGMNYAVALSCGTAALHMAVRLAGYKLYGAPELGSGVIKGKTVFCSDLTFAASANPIVYEGGAPVFIDSELNTWNMDPAALEKAFELYPDTKIVICVHLYGMPAEIEEIREITHRHGAILIEDAAESLGATVGGQQTGSFGDIGVISFNGNKIITGSSGGALLVNDAEDAKLVRKWSTQSRENVPWYEHTQLGYNYRMSNVIAGVIRGQLPYLNEHKAGKTRIYEHYKTAFQNLKVQMSPMRIGDKQSNCWLSCILNDNEKVSFSPMEFVNALKDRDVEARPIWKPMHMQPIYAECQFVSVQSEFSDLKSRSVSEYLFHNGVCLPSDIKMSENQQKDIEDIICERLASL